MQTEQNRSRPVSLCVPPLEVWPGAVSYWLDRNPELVRTLVLGFFAALLIFCTLHLPDDPAPEVVVHRGTSHQDQTAIAAQVPAQHSVQVVSSSQ
jgi:hypothetical protein